ncbi:M14 family metallopeptidase [Synoicihabitans lomoniglobus]|uniref:M14 family metallocarboxypeptidase n=1 Tax=Synoicihabitans lomoniglobus TaxID=2909285 RepID=A0AAF0CS43_9BACT|nr:M14 family metallocarboxypeptidase [Opitutaceae bacterium LMO-M01]WED67012.1 M14 family metallocarboxypeptidase [Opitutaceae bacterium LMO-M01]
MSAVKTCPLDPADLVARFRAAARLAGFCEHAIGEIDGVPLFGYSRRAVGPKPRIYLSAGVHGDEPAPPEALLHMVELGVFDDRATWFLMPMLNPAGFRADQRENAAGIDLNRDYLRPQSPEVAAHVRWLERLPRFDLALCLHEDWEATGFYLYELDDTGRPSFAARLRDAGAAHLPIDPESIIDGRPIDEPGIIRPESDPALRETWPEAIYLREHHTHLCFTTETPTGLAQDQRIATQAAIARRAITETVNTFHAAHKR